MHAPRVVLGAYLPREFLAASRVVGDLDRPSKNATVETESVAPVEVPVPGGVADLQPLLAASEHAEPRHLENALAVKGRRPFAGAPPSRDAASPGGITGLELHRRGHRLDAHHAQRAVEREVARA